MLAIQLSTKVYIYNYDLYTNNQLKIYSIQCKIFFIKDKTRD